MNNISILLLVLLVSASTQFSLNTNENEQILTQMGTQSKTFLSSGVETEQAPFPFYRLKNSNSNLCMMVDLSGLADNVNISQQLCADIPAQKFLVC
jgi:hypothetical protein